MTRSDCLSISTERLNVSEASGPAESETLHLDPWVRLGLCRPGGRMSPRNYAVPLSRSEVVKLPPHPDSPVRSWKRWVEEQARPVAVDLFSGCGGLSLGLEDAGYRVILSVDHDARAAETHKHNLPGRALTRDLSEPESIESVVGLLRGHEIALIAGGPPCQPFSRAGRSKIRSLGVAPEEDDRRELWRSFLDIVLSVKPAAVLLENVPDMALGSDTRILRAILDQLEGAGYDTDARLLDAWRYGVPQHRQRLIVLARRDGRPILWPPQQKKIRLRDAIGDLPRLGDGTGEPHMEAGRARTRFQRAARKGAGSDLWDHFTRAVRDDDREAFKLMKPGTRYSELPEELRRYRSDIFNDKYNRLDWDDLSRSITAHIAKDGYWYIHPEEHRTLTVREAARIQTFPDRFRFAGSRSDAFRQIGNAVPPALAQAVGGALLKGSRARKLRPAQQPRLRRAAIREALLDWARSDARVAPWRNPGNPWATLAWVLLGRDREVAQFLQYYPSPAKGVGARIRHSAADMAEARRRPYLRLAAAAPKLTRQDAWRSRSWAEAAELGGADEQLVRLIGLGEANIPGSAAANRVAVRLGGLADGAAKRRSDSRLEIAKIIGAGKQEAQIGAALHAFGCAVCTASDPTCTMCPLRAHCGYAGARKR